MSKITGVGKVFSGIQKEIFDIINSSTANDFIKVSELGRMFEKAQNKAYHDGFKDGQKHGIKKFKK